MSFREKVAWTAFVTTILAWGGYFAVVVTKAMSGGTHDPILFWLFIGATCAQVVLMVAVIVVSAAISPRDANASPDERDRRIAQRASGIAYAVVLAAIVIVIAWMHVGLHGTNVIFALVGVFILGEAVRFGAQAIGYRVGG